MSYGSDRVKKWRKTTKRRIVESMGGKCVCCGYNKLDDALDLHHIDPNTKEKALGAIRANIINWESIVEELRKCVLICCRCHRELHSNLIELPLDVPKFNEDFLDYRKKNPEDSFDKCPICNNPKPKYLITCSLKCAAKRKSKIDWGNIDIAELYKIHKTFIKVGEILGVSDVAVRKRMKKLNLL